MKKPSLYVDTSVIGGCCDPEFREWSLRLLGDIQKGRFHLMVSDLIAAEVEEAPAEVQEAARWFWESASQFIALAQDSIELAEAYLRHMILPRRFRDDARHIALATIAGADLVVSWNFRHIVHFEKIQMFNAVNLEMGYKTIMIHSPREVVGHER
jgi:predicted nucleic acid-binding protein